MQLHVFEGRYRELVRFCQEFDSQFGVVLIRSGSEVGEAEPYMVGTTARIQNVSRYEDGRMDVTVIGERRFRIRKMSEEKPYLVGFAEPVLDAAIVNLERFEALCQKAKELFEQWVKSVLASHDMEVHVKFPADPATLSFIIANYLHLENLTKQGLLELCDPEQRLAELIPILEHQVVEARMGKAYRLDPSQLQEWISPN